MKNDLSERLVAAESSHSRLSFITDLRHDNEYNEVERGERYLRGEPTMEFDEILEHAIEMLQRRGRLTYRTLRRQFQLDDEALEDLTFELTEGQRIAADENGTVLVWVG